MVNLASDKSFHNRRYQCYQRTSSALSVTTTPLIFGKLIILSALNLATSSE